MTVASTSLHLTLLPVRKRFSKFNVASGRCHDQDLYVIYTGVDGVSARTEQTFMTTRWLSYFPRYIPLGLEGFEGNGSVETTPCSNCHQQRRGQNQGISSTQRTDTAVLTNYVSNTVYYFLLIHTCLIYTTRCSLKSWSECPGVGGVCCSWLQLPLEDDWWKLGLFCCWICVKLRIELSDASLLENRWSMKNASLPWR